MKELNRNLYPRDGYVFIDRDGTRHRSDSWRHLEERVRDYRARNGMDVGDVWAEITTQACARNPNICRDDAPQPAIPEKGIPTPMTFTQKVLHWAIHLIGLKRLNQVPRVSDQEAARRAAICAVCPMQQSLSSVCEQCLTALKNSKKALLDGQNSQHQGLNACRVLTEDCSLSVHIDQPPLDNKALPGHCWRKKQ